MEFIDEQLEANQNALNKTVTEQPTNLYTLNDLNKLINFKGVRFYMDICSLEKEVIFYKLNYVLFLVIYIFIQ